jgi:cytoskeleton protein RodZ
VAFRDRSTVTEQSAGQAGHHSNMATTGQQALRRGIGATLRAERERRHISLDAVARGTLVRQDFLELIDADRLEELPTGAYAKGFIRSYVAYLGLDPKPFLTAYDDRCGQPGPELARFAPQGVRVPPAAQKRAWKFAVGSAVFVLLLLALLGAFRSGDGEDELPSTSAAVARVAASTAPNVMGAVVRLEVISDETWVEAEVDGQPVFANTLQRGEYETFKGDEKIVLFIARGSTVRLTANGQILRTPKDGNYRGVFTASTESLPKNINDLPVAGSEPGAESDAAQTDPDAHQSEPADTPPAGDAAADGAKP